MAIGGVLFLILIGTTDLVFGLDENSVKEKICDIRTPSMESVGLDFNWLGSVDVFYIAMWSKLYAQRTASDLMQKPIYTITEAEIAARPACIQFKKGNKVAGFGYERLYNISANVYGLNFRAPWSASKSGKFAFHLTDNKNFILGITCWEDNQSSWAVLSRTPYLEDCVGKRILDYVVSLGFRLDLAFQEIYVNCNLRSVGGTNVNYGNQNQLLYSLYSQSVPQYSHNILHHNPSRGVYYRPSFPYWNTMNVDNYYKK